MRSEEHMRRQLIKEVNDAIEEMLAKEQLTMENIILVNRIVLIIVFKLRRVLRGLDKKEIQDFIKNEMSCFKKVKATIKKYISDTVRELLIIR